MRKFEIHTFPERCTGCLRCGLACSYLQLGTFNPTQARISITPSDTDYSISFSDDCTGCAVCVSECLFNALKKDAIRGVS